MGIFKSAVSALSKGLERTRRAFSSGLVASLRGRTLDDQVIDEIERSLLTADVGVRTTADIVDELRGAVRDGEISRGEDAIEFLKSRLKARWDEADRSIAIAADGPTVILVAGVNGAGKTTSVAKIAKSLRDENRTVVLAAADTFRAAATEQLAIWADRLGVDVVKGAAGADPASVVFDAADAAVHRQADVLLIDTAGRMHTEAGLMRQLTKIRDVTSKKIPGAPHEVLLVLDATSGQNAIEQARLFKDAIDVTGIFLAKLDGTAKGGIVLAIREVLDVPVKLVGVGERLEDVEPFDPGEFVDAMFGDEDGEGTVAPGH